VTDTVRPTRPALRLPVAVPGTARRTVSIATEPNGDWDEGLLVRGSCRDAVRGVEGWATGPVTQVELQLEPDGRVRRGSGDLPTELADAVRGAPGSRGFRKLLAQTAAFDAVGAVAAILDDLPGVLLVAGYARHAEQPWTRAAGASPRLDICRGWTSGADADLRTRAGLRPVPGIPNAPRVAEMVDDPDEFHHETDLVPRTMRRRRVLDVRRVADGAALTTHFRDSYIDSALSEGSMHEYGVEVDVDEAWVIRGLSVDARSLPFPHCVLAIGDASPMVGRSVASLGEELRQVLTSPKGCTHLTDVLRFLRFAEPLMGSAPGSCSRGVLQ
jgi:Protein of unknown function (DUF2889)